MEDQSIDSIRTRLDFPEPVIRFFPLLYSLRSAQRTSAPSEPYRKYELSTVAIVDPI